MLTILWLLLFNNSKFPIVMEYVVKCLLWVYIGVDVDMFSMGVHWCCCRYV